MPPYRVRSLIPADEHGPNSAPYMVLTYSFSLSHFQDDRSVVGRVVRLSKHPFTIVGVAPPDFQGTLLFISPDFFVPLVNKEQLDGEDILNARGNRKLLMALGHLRAGVTPAQAIADLNSIVSPLEQGLPQRCVGVQTHLVSPASATDF